MTKKSKRSTAWVGPFKVVGPTPTRSRTLSLTRVEARIVLQCLQWNPPYAFVQGLLGISEGRAKAQCEALEAKLRSYAGEARSTRRKAKS